MAAHRTKNNNDCHPQATLWSQLQASVVFAETHSIAAIIKATSAGAKVAFNVLPKGCRETRLAAL
jgi:hypothetical protein